MTSQTLSAFLTSGLTSLVEFIEALTVVLAIGATRGWRTALGGAGAALMLLIVLAAVFGPAVGALPLGPGKFVVGILLVLFGTRWLRKATRRAAGIIPLRDENAAFRRAIDRVDRIGQPVARWDWPGLTGAFQVTAIEGLEVIFVIVAVGAGGPALIGPAIAGAAAALIVVVAAGALLHRPITRVPENTLKRVVGATLAGLGTFWAGEGGGLQWPGEDAAILVLGLGFYLLSLGAAVALRGRAQAVPS